jgi:hypothetical protein
MNKNNSRVQDSAVVYEHAVYAQADGTTATTAVVLF